LPAIDSGGSAWALSGANPMAIRFKIGDHVQWNSEAGIVRGTIQKVVTSQIDFKGYKRHASKDEPQYIIKSDKTDHLAIHKGSALNKLSPIKKTRGWKHGNAGSRESNQR
jgi:hypothetical protein